MNSRRLLVGLVVGSALHASVATAQGTVPQSCSIEAVVLGSGQDAGGRQIETVVDAELALPSTSLAVVDRNDGARYLFDATSAISQHLAFLDGIAPAKLGWGIDGIFLTRPQAEYVRGLTMLGREAKVAKGVPVFAMPRMRAFLTGNDTWRGLVEAGNIAIQPLEADELSPLSDTFGVWPILIPHRDELSETVGFLMMTPAKRALYLPYIDDWEELEASGGMELPDLLAMVDVAYIDAMALLSDLPEAERAKVRLLPHDRTIAPRDAASAATAEATRGGFALALAGDRFCLD